MPENGFWFPEAARSLAKKIVILRDQDWPQFGRAIQQMVVVQFRGAVFLGGEHVDRA